MSRFPLGKAVVAILGLTAATIAVIAISRSLQSSKLHNVSELERLARLDDYGELGCGFGSFRYSYPDGSAKTFESGLSQHNVFGGRVRSEDMRLFLVSRRTSNHTGRGAMSGDVEHLLKLVVETVSYAGDSSLVDELADLLSDPSPRIQRLVQRSLVRMAHEYPVIRSEIYAAMRKRREIPFRSAPTRGSAP